MTPLPLAEIARDEPSLYRIVGPRLPERSDVTLKDTDGGVREHKLSAAPSLRDAGSIPQAIASLLNDAALALAATLPGNPLATDGDRAPTPGVALQNHQAQPGTPDGRAPGKLPVAGQPEKAGSTSAVDAPTHVLSSQGDEPPTLPTGRNQGPAIVAGAPLNSSLRQSESLQNAESVPVAAPSRRWPQMMSIGLALCLVFVLGLVVGLMSLGAWLVGEWSM